MWPGWKDRTYFYKLWRIPIYNLVETRILQTAYTAQIAGNQDNFVDIPKIKGY